MTKQTGTGGWPVIEFFINPVRRQSVQNRNDYAFINGKGDLIPMDRSFANEVGKRYNFPSSLDGQTIRTQLDRLVDNKWFDLDPSSLPAHLQVSDLWMQRMPEIVKQEKITKQQELEMRFALDPGTLTTKKNLHYNLKFRDATKKPNYLEGFTLTLYDRPNRFTDETLRGALAIELAKVSGKIAEDKAHINTTRHDFYIADENEEAIERSNKQEVINNAITDLTLLRRNHTPFLRYQLAIILKLVKGTVSETVVKDEMDNFVARKSRDQFRNIEKFNELIELVNKGVEGADKLHIMYLMRQAVNTNIFSVRNGSYIWHSKKGIENVYELGTKENSIIKFFQDEYNIYDPDNDQENWYGELINELKMKGVRITE